MACYSPLSAFKTDDGQIVFVDTGGRPLQLPCGRCIGCRIQRAEDWTVRLMHEAQMHEHSCFITLTYKDAPASLEYRDFQLFMKRLRFHYANDYTGEGIRFFCAGEYGSQNWRPHFHALLFGIDFAQMDAKVFKESGQFKLYESEALNALWPAGFSSVGRCDPASAAYCANYCISKVDGDKAQAHYTRIDPFTGEILALRPEFGRMSLKPGIGVPWYRKFANDLHNKDIAVLNDGRKKKVPRSYMKLLQDKDPLRYEEICYNRYLRSLDADDSPERLDARARFAKARLDFYNRRSL